MPSACRSNTCTTAILPNVASCEESRPAPPSPLSQRYPIVDLQPPSCPRHTYHSPAAAVFILTTGSSHPLPPPPPSLGGLFPQLPERWPC